MNEEYCQSGDDSIFRYDYFKRIFKYWFRQQNDTLDHLKRLVIQQVLSQNSVSEQEDDSKQKTLREVDSNWIIELKNEVKKELA